MEIIYQIIGIVWVGILLFIAFSIGKNFFGKLKTFSWGSIYVLGAGITGLISFALIWLYALQEWGLLLGLVFGWIPAIIGGFILGIIWPIPVLIIGYILLNSR